MTPVRLEAAALRSRAKHSTTEPLRSLWSFCTCIIHITNTKSESETTCIINLLLVSRVLRKSKARPTAFASAVKKDEPSGIRCILQWLSDISEQPTFESSFDPSV